MFHRHYYDYIHIYTHIYIHIIVYMFIDIGSLDVPESSMDWDCFA